MRTYSSTARFLSRYSRKLSDTHNEAFQADEIGIETHVFNASVMALLMGANASSSVEHDVDSEIRMRVENRLENRRG